MLKLQALIVILISSSCLVLFSSCTPKVVVQPPSETSPPAEAPWIESIPQVMQDLINEKYSEGLYNVGTADGPNEGVAIRKATLQARGELSRQFRVKIDALQQNYEESVNKDIVDEYAAVLETLATLRLQGSIPVKELVRKNADGTYSAKVLVVVTANDVISQINDKAGAFSSFKSIQAVKTLEEKAAKEQEWLEKHEQRR